MCISHLDLNRALRTFVIFLLGRSSSLARIGVSDAFPGDDAMPLAYGQVDGILVRGYPLANGSILQKDITHGTNESRRTGWPCWPSG